MTDYDYKVLLRGKLYSIVSTIRMSTFYILLLSGNYIKLNTDAKILEIENNQYKIGSIKLLTLEKFRTMFFP